jgi:hypothetical protein
MSSMVWVWIYGKETDLTFSQNDQTDSGAHPLSSFMNAAISFHKDKACVPESDRAPSFHTEYKKEWSYTSIPPYAFQLQRP